MRKHGILAKKKMRKFQYCQRRAKEPVPVAYKIYKIHLKEIGPLAHSIYVRP